MTSKTLWHKIIRREKFWSTWDVSRKKNYSNPAKSRVGFFSGVVLKWKEIDDFVRAKDLEG